MQATAVIRSLSTKHEQLLPEYYKLQRRHDVLRHQLRKFCHVFLSFDYILTTASV